MDILIVNITLSLWISLDIEHAGEEVFEEKSQ